MVPNGWVEGKVKSLVKSLDAGVSVNSEDDGNLNSEFKILKTSCVSGDSFDSTKVKSVVKQNEIERLKEPVLSDSIIISRMNTPALVGANGYVEHEIANTYLPDRLWQLKPHKDKVCMRWLGYWFASSPTRHKLGSTATGTSGSMKNITKADVLNISINIPPLPEQQKIAKILTTWDKAIDSTERLIDNSKQQKKALMQQLLTGKKRLLDDNGKRFEGEWEEVQLSEIGKCIAGLTYSPSDVVEDSGLLVLRSSNIQNGVLSFEDNVYVRLDVKLKSKTKENDILICVRNGSKNLIGKSALIKGRAINQAHGAFMTIYRSKYPHYVFHLFQSDLYYRQVNRNLGATINSINTGDLNKFKFYIPNDSKEIEKIAAVLTNADKEIELLEQQLADLQQEKKALMQVLLTGKKRVRIDEIV